MAENLTPREQEVYDLHAAGMRNVDIAQQLNIAAGTVSNALVKALKKLGRESEIGGNGGSNRSGTKAAANDPVDMFKREGALVIRRAQDARDAVENFPGDFDEWLTQNREDLEKQYTQTRESLNSQLVTSQQAEDKWIEFAERVDIDLMEVVAESQTDETEAAVVAANTPDESEDEESEDETEGDQS